MASSASQAPLRMRLGAQLMSHACAKIDFHWGPLHVDGSAFSFIALALASRPPHGLGCAVKNLKSGVEAQYNGLARQFEFSKPTYGTAAFERMTLVHEATHAIADLRAGSKTRGELEETAAFVAGALFNIYSALNLSGPFPYISTNPSDVYFIAHKVALQIAASPGTALDPKIASPLRQAVLKHPTYGFLKANPKYSHSGVRL